MTSVIGGPAVQESLLHCTLASPVQESSFFIALLSVSWCLRHSLLWIELANFQLGILRAFTQSHGAACSQHSSSLFWALSIEVQSRWTLLFRLYRRSFALAKRLILISHFRIRSWTIVWQLTFFIFHLRLEMIIFRLNYFLCCLRSHILFWPPIYFSWIDYFQIWLVIVDWSSLLASWNRTHFFLIRNWNWAPCVPIAIDHASWWHVFICWDLNASL